MVERAIQVLRKAIREKNRLDELLRDPIPDYPEGWFMCVPRCFNKALDIELTPRHRRGKRTLVWTQGPRFSFKVGDTLYDAPKAYGVWSNALNDVTCCVQITAARSARGSVVKENRDAGSVTFSLFRPNRSGTQLVEEDQATMSQDAFVEFLISGPEGDLAKKLRRDRTTQ